MTTNKLDLTMYESPEERRQKIVEETMLTMLDMAQDKSLEAKARIEAAHHVNVLNTTYMVASSVGEAIDAASKSSNKLGNEIRKLRPDEEE